MLARPAGPTTCRWNRTGSGGHYLADARTFAQWQIDFVKADNCHHPHEPPPVYYGNLSHALNISGRAMSFNLCEWGEDAVWTWGTSIAQVSDATTRPRMSRAFSPSHRKHALRTFSAGQMTPPR